MGDLWKLFGINQERSKDRQLGILFDGLSRILQGRDDEHVKLVAGVAGLLGKVAYADSEITDDELDHIRQVLGAEMRISERDVEQIIAILLEQKTRLFVIEDYIYLRFINDVTDRGGKLALLRSLFALAAADGTVSLSEDNAIRSVATGLQLSHKDFVTARREFKEKLSWVAKG